MVEVGFRILSEDKAMVEELRPEYLAREVSVKADMPQTAFRKLRQVNPPFLTSYPMTRSPNHARYLRKSPDVNPRLLTLYVGRWGSNVWFMRGWLVSV
jgi:hypothetical protein